MTRSFGAGGQGLGASRKQPTPSTSQDGRKVIAADSVPLPKLKNLLLSDVVFGFGFGKKHKGISGNKLVSLARDRKKAGYGLQELGIQTCIGFGAKQVRECERFVSKVVWDGDEGEDLVHGCTHHNHCWDNGDFSPDEEYDAHYQFYPRNLLDVYDSDDMDYLPYY